MVIVPSFAPKQLTFVLATAAASLAGWVMTSAGFRTISQVVLAASLILTLYVPGARLVNVPDALPRGSSVYCVAISTYSLLQDLL